MAEFCFECMEKLFEEASEILWYNESDFYTEDDLCEGCGKYKKCVIALNKKGRFKQFFFGPIGLD